VPAGSSDGGQWTSGCGGEGLPTPNEAKAIADKHMDRLDKTVGDYAAKRITREQFDKQIDETVKSFNQHSNKDVTFKMDVEKSGAYSASESIYPYYEITENKEGEEIVGTPSRVRLSRHPEGR